MCAGAPDGGRHERACRRKHHEHDKRGAQQQKQQMAQLQPAGTLTFGVTQVAQGRKFHLGRLSPLEEMEQRWKRGDAEPEQRERVQKYHVSKRSAKPNGISVRT